MRLPARGPANSPGGSSVVTDMQRPAGILLVPLLITWSCSPADTRHPVLEWTGAHDAPEDPTWETTIAPAGEPGEPLLIEGRIVDAQGRPQKGVLVYVYHTNAEGVYPTRGDETGNGYRHGYLRGWMRTGADGRYRFRTIRPGGYPGREDPQHIHVTLTPPDDEERWVDSIWFAGDPRITPELEAARREGRGGPGATITLQPGADGVWHGQRDIVLK